MAILKHISSKNANYGDAEKYLTFEHDEFTMKPTLDADGRLIPRVSKGQEDENGILFVCFPVTAIAAVLSRSPMTVKRSLNELETAGLIMRVRQGIGEPNRIYVLIPGKEDTALA